MKAKQLNLFEKEDQKQQQKKRATPQGRRLKGKLANAAILRKIGRLSIILVIAASLAQDVHAQRVHVRGHYSPKRDTYVMPHYRTAPDRSRTNNWSSRGNVNPYTGKRGTTDPYRIRRH